ncbi:unnamed protein product [Effrenium voratum]|nr:unnamed protein product [Effrenium voratum]
MRRVRRERLVLPASLLMACAVDWRKVGGGGATDGLPSRAAVPGVQGAGPGVAAVAAAGAVAVGARGARASETKPASSGEASSLTTSVLNLAKNIIGAGMLSLPVALKGAGLAPYLLGIAVFGAVNAYSFFLLGWACEVSGAKSFGELWAKSLGGNAWVADVSVLLNNGMACLAYCVLMGDFFSKALAGLLPDVLWLHQRSVDLVIVGASLLVPLSLMKDLAPLRYASLAGLAATAYVFFMLESDSFSANWTVSGPVMNNLTPLRVDFFEALALFSSAFMAHYNAPKFYSQLQDRSVPRFGLLVSLAFGLALLVFMAFGVCGFALFGFDVEGNVLKNYDFSPKVMLAWLSMGFSVAFTYPLVFSTFRDSFTALTGSSDGFRVVFTIAAVFATVIGGSIFSNVAKVNGVKGAILSPCLAFVFPALIHLKLTKPSNRSQMLMRSISKCGSLRVPHHFSSLAEQQSSRAAELRRS